MIDFKIYQPEQSLRLGLQEKVDNLTKPKGSLGLLEDLAIEIGLIQETLSPKLNNPQHVVFASDHGISDEGVSLSPRDVTQQMIFNFLDGGAGVNFLTRQHNIGLKVVDMGVDFDFPETITSLIGRKIRHSTRNYLYEAAMSYEEADLALKAGAEIVEKCYSEGTNIISFGEMGITNTSSSSLWISLLMNIPLDECVGAGCDNSGGIISHKYSVLNRALQNYKGDGSSLDIMSYFGGYEMVATVGAMLKAAELKMVIVVDGFIMTACIMMAASFDKNVIHYAIYGHQGDEFAHKSALDFLGAKPILHIGLRLGEGTGALCAYPIIDSAVRMINEMNSFKTIKVSKYF